jgi:guanylate kinase
MVRSIIFSAPSGSGKTTIVKHILQTFPNIKFSVSATTRPMRPGEVDGKDYHFISVEDFKSKIESGEFIEYEEVYPGLFYGTLKSEVQKIWNDGGIVIYDMDVVGGINLKKQFGDESLSFFVKVPSIEKLEQRLRSRGTESEEKIQMRVSKAKQEMDYEDQFDFVLINNNLENTLKIAQEIISSL